MDKKNATSPYKEKKTTSSEYKPETESNTGLALLVQQTPPLTSPSPSPPTILPPPYTMS